MNFLRYLLHGSDEQVMPKSWLADTHRLALYQAAQARETWCGGAVVRNVEQMRQAAFWEARKPKPAERQPWVAQFRKGR